MKLYHGTSIKNLESILANGLRPRGDSPGHWEDYPSRPDMVYLTTAYPFFFGLNTRDDDKTGTTRHTKLVIEIESTQLDQDLLYPDEDFVVQLFAYHLQKSLSEIHDAMRARLIDISQAYDDSDTSQSVLAWEESINALTTCCYRGTIPRKAMTRYCVFDPTLRPLLTAMTYNEGPHLAGPHDLHRQLTQWMFGNRRKLPRFIPTAFINDMGDDSRRFAPYLRHPNFKQEEKCRKGITIVTL